MRKSNFLGAVLVFHTFVGATGNADHIIESFKRPVLFTREGLKTFFTDVFNDRAYGTLYLPASFVHMIDFLSQSGSAKDPYVYIGSVVDVFHIRLKESIWVNPYALAQLLDALKQRVGPLMQKQASDEDVRVSVKASLYKAVLFRFNELKNDPEKFMTALSDEVVTLVQQSENHHLRELSYTMGRFIEAALDKLIWDPYEQQAAWESCLLLADQLYDLYDLSIISDEIMLNSCYWSLVYRFCYFIEISGDQLESATYQKMSADIQAGRSRLFTLEESEPCMISKAQRLQRAIFEGEVKTRSIKSGLWVA